MKKILQLTTVAALLFTASRSTGQITNGTFSADWTLTDINGVSQNLYSYLNAGKTVFIDISATWCGPCWSYHNSGALESIWVNHGPLGGTNVSASTTNDCMVFFIEGDGTTTSADLNGTGSNTQGNWVAGVSHPIIDPPASAVSAFNQLYHLTYFPTCIMICPDRTMTEVDQYTAADLYTAKATCATATAPVDAEMMSSFNLNSLASCDSVTPTFLLGNIGTSTLTSAEITYKVDNVAQKVYNWSGNLATYSHIAVTGVKVGALSQGSHTISAVITGANGGSDPTANNTTNVPFTIFSTTGGAPVSESFESGGIPTTFMLTNGNSGSTWDNATVGFGSSSSAFLDWYNIPSGDIDIMSLPPISFASASTPSLSFDVAYSQYSSQIIDKLQVEVSTNCGNTWTAKYTKAGSALATVSAHTTAWTPSLNSHWRHETVALTSYAGNQSVLIRFKGTSGFGNNIYIDNINVSGATGIEENKTVNNISIYPNPVTSDAFVAFELVDASNVSINVSNALGQVVMKDELGKMSAGAQNYVLNTSTLNNGLYFVTIKVGNSVVTKRIAVNK